jgi:carboxymethylenebutenolidase
MPPECYDPASPDEMPVPLPCAPRENLPILGATLQPPLTRRGHGPGLIVFLPLDEALGPPAKRSLDPQPQMKWAEEGYAVVAVSCTSKDVHLAIDSASAILRGHEAVDTKDKIAIIG